MEKQTDLQSWRKPRKSWSIRPWAIALCFVGLVSTLCVYVLQLAAPYNVPKVYVLALAPVPENEDHEAHQIPALINSRVDQIREVLVQSGEQGSYWDIPIGLNIDALRRLKKFSFERENNTSLGILYISGLLGFHEQELYLYGSHGAQARGEGISVEQIFGFAEQSSYASCLILIDVIPEVEKPLDSAFHFAKMNELQSEISEVLSNAKTEIGFLVQNASSTRAPQTCFSGALSKQLESNSKDQHLRLGAWLEGLRSQTGTPLELYTSQFNLDNQFAIYRDAVGSEPPQETAGEIPTQETKDSSVRLVSHSKIADSIDAFANEQTDLVAQLESADISTQLKLSWARLTGLNQAQFFRRYPYGLTDLENRLVAFEKCLRAEAHVAATVAIGPDAELLDMNNAMADYQSAFLPITASLPGSTGNSVFNALHLEREFLIPMRWTLGLDQGTARVAEELLSSILNAARHGNESTVIKKLLDTAPAELQQCIEFASVQVILQSDQVTERLRCELIACKLMLLELFYTAQTSATNEAHPTEAAALKLANIERALQLNTASHEQAASELSEIQGQLYRQLEMTRWQQFATRLLFLFASELPNWQTVLPPVSVDTGEQDTFLLATQLFSQLNATLAAPQNQLVAADIENTAGRLWALREQWIGRQPSLSKTNLGFPGSPPLTGEQWQSPRWDRLQAKVLKRLDSLTDSNPAIAEQVKATELRRLLALVAMLDLKNKSAARLTQQLAQTVEQCIDRDGVHDATQHYAALRDARTLSAELLRLSLRADELDRFARVVAGRLGGQIEDHRPGYDAKATDGTRQALKTYFQTRFDRIAKYNIGADLKHAQTLDSMAKGLRNLESRLALDAAAFQEQPIRIVAPDSISIKHTLARSTSFKIANESDTVRGVKIELAYDPSKLACELGSSNRPLQLDIQAHEQLEFDLQVTRLVAWAEPTSLQVCVSTGEDSIQSSIRIALPSRPQVNVDLHQGDSAQRDAHERLVANALTSLRFRVMNAGAEDTFQFRIWTSPTRIAALLLGGVVSAEDSEQILRSENCICITDWTAAQTLLEKESCDPVFSALPSLKKPLESLALETLLVECRNSTGSTQLVGWNPRVLRPDSYIACRPHFDSNRELVDFSFQIHDAVPQRNVPIRLTVYREATLQAIDQQETSLRPGKLKARLQWSNFPTEFDRLLFRIDVDGWPSAFLFAIDPHTPDGVLEQVSTSSYVILEQLSDQAKIARGNRLIQAKAFCLGKNALLDTPGVRLRVGIDLNRNRVLDDGTSVELSNTCEVRPRIQSFDKAGQLQIFVGVDGPRVDLSLRKAWNVRACLLAELDRNNQTSWSPIEPLIIDNSSPKVLSARPRHPTLEVGLPAAILVKTDDAGLSGVTQVQASWSTNGALDFSETKPLEAVRLQPDEWSIELPTKNLPAGKHLFLCQATDAAGNISHLFSEWIQIYAPEAATAIRQKSSAMVQGTVKYGKVPQKGIHLKLTTLPSKEDKQPANSASALSDEQGRFQFLNVPIGKYTLELSGIAHGMQEKRVVEVEVIDDVKPVEVTFRLDLPAVSAK